VTNNSTSSNDPSLSNETSSTTFNQIISSSIINNDKNIEDRDHFYYTSTSVVLATTTIISWNRVIRGSAIYNAGFVPKYTSLYSISVSFFFGTGSTGFVRIGIQLNGQNKWNIYFYSLCECE
jgi:hypothetical protein